MPATIQPLTTLTAGDLMSRAVIQVPETMPLREAARLLLQHQISGVPVVAPDGACVGMLSSTDLVRWLQYHKTDALPLTCQYQHRDHEPDGADQIRCTLPIDACPLQRTEKGPDDEERIVCSDPHTVLCDWQVVEMEQLPADEVRRIMTRDPVMVAAETPVTELARQMIDAHIHRLIVVDERHRPIGIVSSTDVLARVARMG